MASSPPNQVNRIPSGFLDLLGVQSLGKNPPLYGPNLGPMVDLTELYLAQTLSSHTVDFVHTAFNQQGIFSVPEGETWLLRAIGVRCTLPSTASLEQWEFSLDSVARPSTGGATSEPGIFVTPRLQVAIANHTTAAAVTFGTHLALLGGTVLRARIVDRDTGAGRTTALNWLFNRLKQ